MDTSKHIGSRKREGKKYTVENEALDRITKEAEAKLAQRKAARAEAREMRMKELEKHPVDEENDDDMQCDGEMAETPQLPPPVTRNSLSRSTHCNSNDQFSRRSSEDSVIDENLPEIARELKVELKEMEEKFRKAMISNAQLDNEKTTLTYEVEFLKDKFSELEESNTQLLKSHKKKCSENEQLRKLSNKLKEEIQLVRRFLQERDELIQEYGLVVVGEEDEDESSFEEDEDLDITEVSPKKSRIKKALLSQEVADLLSKGPSNDSLDIRLKKFAEEKHELEDEIRRMKMELEEEYYRQRRENGLDSEKQKEIGKYCNEYKLRMQKAEAEVSTLQVNVARLESLVTRYKSQTEELEKSEEELKIEKRKLLRELREAQNRLEETELLNSHLQKRMDKIKCAKSSLLKDISQDPT